jgi:hypothetical protein
MRRLIFSVICSSGRPAKAPKPTSVAITSSHQIVLWRNESTNFKLLAHRAHPRWRRP